MSIEDLPLKSGILSLNVRVFFFFFAFTSKERLFNEAYIAGSILAVSEGGIDPSIHRVDQSFKLQVFRHVVWGYYIEIRHDIP